MKSPPRVLESSVAVMRAIAARGTRSGEGARGTAPTQGSSVSLSTASVLNDRRCDGYSTDANGCDIRVLLNKKLKREKQQAGTEAWKPVEPRLISTQGTGLRIP